MMIGMVADGVIRRISQQNRPLIPSHGVIVNEIHNSVKDPDLYSTKSSRMK